jgi:hypothetical protein
MPALFAISIAGITVSSVAIPLLLRCRKTVSSMPSKYLRCLAYRLTVVGAAWFLYLGTPEPAFLVATMLFASLGPMECLPFSSFPMFSYAKKTATMLRIEDDCGNQLSVQRVFGETSTIITKTFAAEVQSLENKAQNKVPLAQLQPEAAKSIGVWLHQLAQKQDEHFKLRGIRIILYTWTIFDGRISLEKKFLAEYNLRQ